MSTLTGLISAGGGGGAIASVQSGYHTAPQAATTSNRGIGAVDLSKSFVLITYAVESGITNPFEYFLRAALTTSTNIQFYRYTALAGSLDDILVYWQVIEYA